MESTNIACTISIGRRLWYILCDEWWCRPNICFRWVSLSFPSLSLSLSLSHSHLSHSSVFKCIVLSGGYMSTAFRIYTVSTDKWILGNALPKAAGQQDRRSFGCGYTSREIWIFGGYTTDTSVHRYVLHTAMEYQYDNSICVLIV